ncbi:DUF3054 domain-containing protein [Aneurinibacillus terranovensis]|uniref:DUF3054 domain-containing protein n=1 Tax=Aneurinibacillus terranovensis TaxID=278991 RepID=UPI0003F75C70|nr:DUF3054 domain-containing protein [Aneurinibacillus terranovensis]
MAARKWTLIIGDMICFLLFILLGDREHSISINILGLLSNLIPFILAWLLVGFITGIYKKEVLGSMKRVVVRTFITSLIANPIGVLLRALLLGHGISIPFLIVTTVFNTALLVIWRTVFAWFSNKNSKHSGKK